MSLVNDMLNDLDKRREQDGQEKKDVSWLNNPGAASQEAKPKRRSSPWLLLAVVAVVSFVLIQEFKPEWFVQNKTEQPESVVAIDDKSQQSPIKKSVQKNTANSAEGVTVLNQVSKLESVQLKKIAGGAALQLKLKKIAPYRINKSADSVQLTLLETESLSASNLPEVIAPIKALAVEKQGVDAVLKVEVVDGFAVTETVDRENATVILQFKSPESIAKTNLVEDKEPSKLSKTAPKKDKSATVAKAVTANTATNKVATPTAQQLDINTARDAKMLMVRGNAQQAETLLLEFLNERPVSMRSGLLLTTIYLSQKDFVKANAVLLPLEEKFASHANVKMARARLSMARGESAKAVEVLMRNKPAINQHADYYELLANAARQAGEYPLAEEVYRGLVAEDDSRGDWWVGLGIVQDAQAKTQQAGVSYRRALLSQKIKPALRDYAQKRLAVITRS